VTGIMEVGITRFRVYVIKMVVSNIGDQREVACWAESLEGCISMIRENWQLVTDEPVEFEK
jgi:hypothetical protein